MATFKTTGSDEHDMIITITLNGGQLSYDQVGELYNAACESGTDSAFELEEILNKADRILRDAKLVVQNQRVSDFYRDNPDYECVSDPVIRNW